MFRRATTGLRDRLRAKLRATIDDVAHVHHVQQREELRAELADTVAQVRAELRAEVDRAVQAVRDLEARNRRHLHFAGDRDAAAGSARFVAEQMPGAVHLADPHATLEHALSIAPTEGMACEFGVYTGSTLRIIAKHRAPGPIYGFDSFSGLPDDWRAGFPAGTFDAAAEGSPVPEVDGAEVVAGLFGDTLPGFLAAHPGPVTFLHVDADLYSSARTVLDLVGPRLVAGSVVVFNEYFNYPGWEGHEHRAWQEWVAATGARFRYEAFTIADEQVVVRITEVQTGEVRTTEMRTTGR